MTKLSLAEASARLPPASSFAMSPALENRLSSFREVAAVFVSSGLFFAGLLCWAWMAS